jgi:hypothetical protein
MSEVQVAVLEQAEAQAEEVDRPMAGLGVVRCGWTRHGEEPDGLINSKFYAASFGMARLGQARLGMARLGWARLG